MLQKAVEEAKKFNTDDATAVREAKDKLVSTYKDFEANGQNKAGLWSGSYEANLTDSVFVEGSSFSRSEGGSARFGKPANWTVENFKISNGSDGTKQGLDKYAGAEALMLGVWNDRDNNESGDLTNARIYRKVRLAKGTYYFGAGFNANYQLSKDAYMFVSKELSDTKDIPATSIAFYNINQVTTDRKVYGLWFNIPEDMDVYVGFQANLKTGSATQEFRAEKVVLYGFTL